MGPRLRRRHSYRQHWRLPQRMSDPLGEQPLHVVATLDEFIRQRPALRGDLDRLCREYPRHMTRGGLEWLADTLRIMQTISTDGPQRDDL